MLSNDQISDQLDGLTFSEAKERLQEFDAYADRSVAMILLMLRAPNAAERLKLFLEFGNSCGVHWPNRLLLARLLRGTRDEVDLRDLLEQRARSFYDSLPEIVTVWRGCERGRERGLFWTTNRMTARRFAGNNAQPTLVKARIPKHHILAVFVDNEEDEIVLYPKALPRRIEPHPPLYLVRPDHSIEEIWQEMMIRG
jgi:hypothetical protein